jgi:hypothetical protein
VGIRRTLARAAEVIAGKHPPWMEIRYGPPSLVPQMERWRSGTGKRDGPAVFARGPDKVWPPGILKTARAFITQRRTGESPPGIVKELTMNNIDSSARSKLPARGRLNHGVLKDIYCLTANFMPERMEKKPRKDAETQRYAMIGFLDRMVSSRLLSGSLNHRGKLLEMGRKLTGSIVPRSLLRPSSPVPWNEWMYEESSLRAAVPRPPSLVPLQTTINLIST